MVMGTDAPLITTWSWTRWRSNSSRYTWLWTSLRSHRRQKWCRPRGIEYKDQHCSGLCDVCRCNGRDQFVAADEACHPVAKTGGLALFL